MMPEAKKILLLGAGGHCLSVLDSLLSSCNYEKIGIVDREYAKFKDNKELKESSLNICESTSKEIQFVNPKLNNTIMGIPIVGSDENLEELFKEGYTDAFITVGSIGDISVRRKLYQLIKRIGFHIPNVIDKTSVVSIFATYGEGIFIGKNAVVNAYAKIGNCAIINTASVVEHECNIEEFVHIAPGSILSGNVHVAANTHIGAGTIIKQGLQIGSDSMIGMGSVVLKNIGNKVTAYGSPCKEVDHE